MALMDVLKNIASKEQIIIVVSSRFEAVKAQCDQLYEIKNGLIQCLLSSPRQENEMCLVERDDQFSKWAYTMQCVSKFKTFKLITTILCSLVIALVVLSTTVSRQVLERQEQLLTNMIDNEIIVSVEHGEFLNESQIYKVYEMKDFKAIKSFSYMNASIDGLEIVIQPYHEYMAYDVFKQGNDRTFVSYGLNEKLSSSQLDVDIFLDGHPYALENTPISIDATLESRQVNPYGKNPHVIYLDEQQYQSLYQKYVV